MLRIAYLCDKRACPSCNGVCSHTFDITHAINFSLNDDVIFEKVPEKKDPLNDISMNLEDLGKTVKCIANAVNDIGDIGKKLRKDFKK